MTSPCSRHALVRCYAALLLAGVSVAGVARATAEPLTVLVRLEERVPARWHAAVLDSARAAVAELSAYAWLPPPEISLEESRTLLGCHSWDPDCVARIGQSLGARHVLYVEVIEPFQQPPVLTLFQVDVAAPGRALAVGLELPDDGPRGELALQALVRSAVRGPLPTALLVDSEAHPEAGLALVTTAEFADTRVELDGVEVGSAAALRAPALTPGPHRVTLRKAGYRSTTLALTVRAGQPTLVAVDLQHGDDPEPQSASGVAPAAAPSTAGLTPTPAWGAALGWTAAGLGGAGLLGAAGLYLAHYFTAQQLVDAVEAAGQGQVTALSQADYVAAEQRVEPLYRGAVVAGAVGLGLTGLGVALLLWPDQDTAAP